MCEVKRSIIYLYICMYMISYFENAILDYNNICMSIFISHMHNDYSCIENMICVLLCHVALHFTLLY